MNPPAFLTRYRFWFGGAVRDGFARWASPGGEDWWIIHDSPMQRDLVMQVTPGRTWRADLMTVDRRQYAEEEGS
jgi:hypothetical protein